MIAIRRAAVYLGSSPGVRPSYAEAARSFGRLLARESIGLVYGGASVGLMGALADGALSSGGEVIGVLPRSLEAREIGHRHVTHLELVDSMHERKARMADLADAFVALPGGLGTLDELAEVLTWALLGIHAKPVGLLDVDGYFAPLCAFLDHAVDEGFLRVEHRALLLVEQDAERLLARLRAFTPPSTPRWAGPSER